MKTIDVGAVLDEGRWTGYQKLLIVGTALTIILDGVDNQLLPNALPTLMAEWGLPRSAFVNVLAIGPFGMMIGGAARRHARRSHRAPHGAARQRAGVRRPDARDRLPRTTCSCSGCCASWSGVGLGGAMPNAATLASEYVPRRQRPFAVTLTIVCIPLGGALAALLAGRVIPAYGWRGAVRHWRRDPDRPGARAVQGAARVAALPGAAARAMARAVGHAASHRPRRASGRDICGRRRCRRRRSRRPRWAPSSRRRCGATRSACGRVLLLPDGQLHRLPADAGDVDRRRASRRSRAPTRAAFNFGGVAGAIFGALVIQRLGSRITMLGHVGAGDCQRARDGGNADRARRHHAPHGVLRSPAAC